MLRTRATRRCSTAPAEALQTAGVTPAARRSGITTPAAPDALRGAADRAEVLGVLHLVERDHQRLDARQQLAARPHTDRRRPRRRRPGGRPSRSARSICSAETTRTAHARQPRLACGARGRPDLADAVGAPAAQRLADAGCDRRGSRRRRVSSKPAAGRREPPSRARAISRAARSAGREVALGARPLALLGELARRPRRLGMSGRDAGDSPARARRASRAGRRRRDRRAPVGLPDPLEQLTRAPWAC